MAFIDSCGSFKKAWNTCTNTSWMIWYINNVEHIKKACFISLAQQFAKHVEHLNNQWSKRAADAYAAERKWQCDLIRSMFKI